MMVARKSATIRTGTLALSLFGHHEEHVRLADTERIDSDE
jgi:hypothetical protein